MGATAVSAQDETLEDKGTAETSTDEGIELVPDNGKLAGMWCATRLGSLAMPADDGDFWTSAADEIRDLEWNLMDWDFIREQLTSVASQLEAAPDGEPIIELPGKTARERVFLERWFGYGDVCCAAQLKGSRTKALQGLHRIRAVANYPFTDADAEALGLPQASFSAGTSLPPNTMLPILVC